ncbi:MAG: hypothetical protein MZV64_30215 [Ignavibacteriales bacterium]|nr:hypothetical protein [Ignavibacteriales bacterium]
MASRRITSPTVAERALDGVDRRRLVPLGVEVGLLEIAVGGCDWGRRRRRGRASPLRQWRPARRASG